MPEQSNKKHLKHIAEAMKDIDFVMLNTHTKGGQIGARPMSNNREVDYDGDSYYFTWDDSLMAEDIKRDPKVGLSIQGAPSSDGVPGIFISVEGAGKLIHDKTEFEKHWTKDLDHWFEDGAETDGLVMIHVQATRVAYWDGEDDGDFAIAR